MNKKAYAITNGVAREERRRIKPSSSSGDALPIRVKGLCGFLACILMLFMAAIAQAQGVNVSTYHNDAQRTGWNQSETVLTPANVTPSTFGLITSVPLDGVVDAQPLVVSGLTIGATSGLTVVYVATENNSVYAIDGASGNILLQANFGTPVARDKCRQMPLDGIVGTPTIDSVQNRLFIIALANVGGQPTFQLHALDLRTLQDTQSPVNITASETLQDGSVYNFDANVAGQRPALLEANGNVYAGFGGCAETQFRKVRGWLLGWNATTLTPLGAKLTNTLVLTTNPLFYVTSIWMSGYGVAADPSGNLYFATGDSNHKYNTYTGTTNIQETAVKLSPDLTTVLDFFTPSNVFQLDEGNKDFGSGGVMVLPPQSGPIPNLAVAGGKDGRLFILNRDNMGGFQTINVPANVKMGACWCGESYYQGSDGVGRVVTSGGAGKLPDGNSVSQLKTWTINTSRRPALKREALSPLLQETPQDPGAFTSISSNGMTPNTAIIWAVSRPDPNDSHVTLYAFNGTAQSGSLAQLWSGSAGFWPGDHNANLVPTVANGMVYVASDHQLAIFGLLSPAAQLRTSAKLQGKFRRLVRQ